MVEFGVHDENSAPAEITPELEQLRSNFGFIPNIYGVMAESPQAFRAYRAAQEQFLASSLSRQEQHVVWLAVSRQNSCGYCLAVHSAVAQGAGVDSAVIDAIRQDKPIGDGRLEAVRRFARTVVERQGWVQQEEIAEFLAAGFERRQMLDIVTGVAMKTLSNYINHLADTPLDDAFAAYAWSA
ncbi:peroxidase-related enzyme [Haloechinothrix sp. LS1_15]|uniref:carboxymuconolactone decarboxylase family protein n=1 Tax=Haloechinothrix sp. LS1_15 TaxID=2652248 RepID=UPI00294794E4|nr:peroxidase-related enzyme [Haloechinothrix sp. LS1_15]MDV6013611.1 peroxidase-related enzyme [Haloechinothrix sp. LS1_15]